MPTRIGSRKSSKQIAAKRTLLRDKLWPGSDELIWSRYEHDGYTTIPRVLPLITHLLRLVTDKGKGNPSPAYVDLWCRVFDEGLVEIRYEDDCAFSSGYTGTRAVRTWREHMDTLVDLRFIEVRPKGNKKFGFVLIRNPILVSVELHHRDKRVTENWWSAFIGRAQEVGADIEHAEALFEAAEALAQAKEDEAK